MKAQLLPLFSVNLSQPLLNSTSTQFQRNFKSTLFQPPPQYQLQLNLNLYLNPIWLWHKINPILCLKNLRLIPISEISIHQSKKVESSLIIVEFKNCSIRKLELCFTRFSGSFGPSNSSSCSGLFKTSLLI